MYLLVFFEPHESQAAQLPSLRKEMLIGCTELSPYLFLDSADSNEKPQDYRYLNIYHTNESDFHGLPSVIEHLQACVNDGHLVSYHWQLHKGIMEFRQSSIPTAVVVSVGMTISDDTVSEKELTQWYEKEHFPALATVPGWLAGFRSRLLATSDPESTCAAPYLAIHEWGAFNDLGGEMWKKAVMTPWTERITSLHTAPVYRRLWKIGA